MRQKYYDYKPVGKSIVWYIIDLLFDFVIDFIIDLVFE